MSWNISRIKDSKLNIVISRYLFLHFDKGQLVDVAPNRLS